MKCAKVDKLLTKVQNTALSAAIAQLHFQLNTEGVTFTVAANHLNSAVLQTVKWQERLHQPIPMKGSREVVVVEAMANSITMEDVAEVAEVVAVLGVVAHLEIRARVAASIQTIIHLLNGTNYPWRNVTKFAKSMTRKANKTGPSGQLVIFQSNSSQQSLVRSNMIKLQPLLPIPPTPIPLETMLEMPLAEKREQSESSSLD